MVKNTCCVSVVVPTYKRPHMLEHCLAALLEQDFDATA
ncbi:MAG: glycosyltransferase family 2 protein, partial [Ktedonobacteraceae bacterium]